MAARHVFPLYHNDFYSFVRRENLTLEEEAVYLRLLVQMFEAGGELPDDPARLAKIVSVHKRTFNRCYNRVVSGFFQSYCGTIHHLRVTKILEQHNLKSEKARRSADARWEKERENQRLAEGPGDESGDANALRFENEAECERNAIRSNQIKSDHKKEQSPPSSGILDLPEAAQSESSDDFSEELDQVLKLHPKATESDRHPASLIWQELSVMERHKVLIDLGRRAGEIEPEFHFAGWFVNDDEPDDPHRFAPGLVKYLTDREQRYWRNPVACELQPKPALSDFRPYSMSREDRLAYLQRAMGETPDD